MKEINFAAEIKNACAQFECWYYKIPDAHTMERFTPQKPFDAFILYRGRFFAIELKFKKDDKPFSLDSIKEHQIEGLNKAYKNGGTPSIIINYRFIKDARINRVFVIPAKNWFIIKEFVEKEMQRKSIPYKLFDNKLIPEGLVYEMERTHLGDKLHWNIHPILIKLSY